MWIFSTLRFEVFSVQILFYCGRNGTKNYRTQKEHPQTVVKRVSVKDQPHYRHTSYQTLHGTSVAHFLVFWQYWVRIRVCRKDSCSFSTLFVFCGFGKCLGKVSKLPCAFQTIFRSETNKMLSFWWTYIFKLLSSPYNYNFRWIGT